MIETSFAEFLRKGGNNKCSVRLSKGEIEIRTAWISTKDAIPNFGTLRTQFLANLDRASEITIRIILSVVQRSFDAPVSRDALPNLTEDRESALEEWERRIALYGRKKQRDQQGSVRCFKPWNKTSCAPFRV